jgi:hypothetical protein
VVQKATPESCKNCRLVLSTVVGLDEGGEIVMARFVIFFELGYSPSLKRGGETELYVDEMLNYLPLSRKDSLCYLHYIRRAK